MATKITIGDSIDVEFSLDGIDLSDFTCQMQVRDKKGAIAGGIDRAITTRNVGNTAFIDRITRAETDLIGVGGYSISALITNAGTGQSRELDGDFQVVKKNNY